MSGMVLTSGKSGRLRQRPYQAEPRSHRRPRLPQLGRHQQLATLCRLFARPKRLRRSPTHSMLICKPP
jgi:hypothetical protein